MAGQQKWQEVVRGCTWVRARNGLKEGVRVGKLGIRV